MDDRSARASRAAAAMMVVQVAILVGQLLYSSLTARLFSPREFGEFAAALSLQGVIVLAAMTGLPSYILREPALSRRLVIRLRLFALVGAIIGAAAFMLLSPVWLGFLNAEGGVRYTPLLVIAIVVAPFAGIESALLRRESRRADDAIILLAAFIISTISASAVAVTTGEAWALALVAAINSLIVLVASRARRGYALPDAAQAKAAPLSFVAKVTAQNLVFLVINQTPGWLISSGSGAGSLGQFTRSTTLTQQPASSIATALNRAVQPMWRHVDDGRRFGLAALDAVRISACLASGLFAIVAAVGEPLARIWLGDGWDLAGTLVAPLAVGAAAYVPFTILAAALEMRGRLGEIRIAQGVLIVGLAVAFLCLTTTRDIHAVAVSISAAQVVALLVILSRSRRNFSAQWQASVMSVVEPWLWGTLIGVVTTGATLGLATIAHGPASEVLILIGAGTIGVVAFVTSLRWQSATLVAARRGVRVPALLIGGRSLSENGD